MPDRTYNVTSLREPPISPRVLLFAVAAIVLLHFAALGTMPLMDPDEGRYAEIPREMLATGDFVTPHLNGVAYIEKPPLYYWGSAASQALLGKTEFGARAFGAAVSLLGVFLAWWMGRAVSGPRTGFYAALVLSTSLYHYIIGRLNATDMTLGVMLVLAIFPSWLYLSGKRESRGWLWLGFAGAGLAFLAKGLVGIVFPAAIVAIWALAVRRPRAILKLFSPVGIAVFLAVALPWVVLVQKANPDFLDFFFIREHFQRFTTERIHQRGEPFWFFIPIVPAGIVPWLFFADPVVRSVRERAARFMAREDRIFFLTWILFVLGFFTVSSSKLPTYMTPLFPPLAVLAGRGLSIWEERGVRAESPVWAAFAFSIVLAAGIAVAPLFTKPPIPWAAWVPAIAPSVVLALAFGAVTLSTRKLGAGRVILASFALFGLFLCSLNRPAGMLVGEGRSGKAFAKILNAEMRPGDVLAQYQTYVQSVPFYTGKRNVLVEEVGELEYGMNRAADRADWFIDRAAFDNLWASDKRIFCIFRRDAMPLIREKYPDHRLLLETRRGILIVNR